MFQKTPSHPDLGPPMPASKINHESGPMREPTLVALRNRAKGLRDRAKQMIATACQMELLARQLEEIKKVACANTDGAEGGVYIGEGSDADHALWRLVVSFPWNEG